MTWYLLEYKENGVYHTEYFPSSMQRLKREMELSRLDIPYEKTKK